MNENVEGGMTIYNYKMFLDCNYS